MNSGDQIQVVSLEQGPPLAIVDGEGGARAVIWPGMGATLRSIHWIELAGGAQTIALRHPSEAVYYVTAGSGEAVDLDADDAQPLRAGSMAHIDPGTTYVLAAAQDGISLLGGPAPPDPGLYEELRS